MLRSIRKKGSLSLSINAIVVVVLAFVMLGLGVSLTRVIFGAASGKVPEAIGITQLEAQPSSENPITLTETVRIKRGDTIDMKVGYYNRDTDSHDKVILKIGECFDQQNTQVVKKMNGAKVESDIPTITSIAQKVGASDIGAFRVLIKENSLPAGTYICTIEATETIPPAGSKYTLPYETKQFTLQVTS